MLSCPRNRKDLLQVKLYLMNNCLFLYPRPHVYLVMLLHMESPTALVT
jgi:hypothetical protein